MILIVCFIFEINLI